MSQVVGFAVQYADRLILGALLPLAYLTYYAIPLELVNRLSVCSHSLGRALFPSLSALKHDKAAYESFARAVKFLFILAVPITCALFFLAGPLLGLYVGKDLAGKSTPVLKIVSIGFLIYSLGSIAHIFVLALGYPDRVAKFHLLELPLYVAVALAFVKVFKVEGMASALLLRRIAETTFLFLVLRSVAPQSLKVLLAGGILKALLTGVLLGAFMAFASLCLPFDSLVLIIFLIGFLGYALTVWSKAFSVSEREKVNSMIKSLLFFFLKKREVEGDSS